MRLTERNHHEAQRSGAEKWRTVDGWDVGFLTRLEIQPRAERMDTARDASTWASSPERLCRYADDGVTPTSEPKKTSAPTSTRPRTSTSAPVLRLTSRPHERETFFVLCEGRREEGAHGALPLSGSTGGGMAGVWGSSRRISDPVSSLLPFSHII